MKIKIIKSSRIARISRGAGVQESDVKELLKYYNNTKKAVDRQKERL